MDEAPCPRGGRGLRHHARPLGLHPVEIPVQDADQVHHHLGALHGAGDGGGIRHRRVQRHDLANAPLGAEKARSLRVPTGDAHDVVLRRQPLHHVATDETGAAEHRRHLAIRHAHDPHSIREIRADHMGMALLRQGMGHAAGPPGKLSTTCGVPPA